MTQREANAHFKKNRIYVDVFSQYVFVFFTKEDWEKAFKFREGDQYNHDINGANGFSFKSVLVNEERKESDTLFAIGIFENDPSIVVHECVHMAGEILEHIEYREQKQGDEISAYLTQFLFRETIKMMKRHYNEL
jgi:hypothetical protein